MSLILACKCADGTLIVASDGAGTIDLAGRPFLKQRLAPKLYVGLQSIAGMTGPYSLAQRWQAIVEDTRKNGVGITGQPGKRKPLNLATKAEAIQWLRLTLFDLVRFEIEVAQTAGHWLTSTGANYAALTKSVCALLIEGEPRLLAFNETGTPEEVDEANPIHCLGSGEAIAAPFCQFWLRTALQHRTPTTDEALLITGLTFRHVFDLSLDVGPPLQVVLFEPVGGKSWRTRELDPEEVGRLMDQAETFEKALPPVFAATMTGEPAR